MRFRFRSLPGAVADVPRPIVPIAIQGLEASAIDCLVDTGSFNNCFAVWIADEAGIRLEDVEPETVGLGGRSVTARAVTVGLRLGDHSWEAPVSFCDPWPWDFNLLGQEGFLRWFRVVIEAADRSLEITPQA